jgi:hypothetical protein
MYYTYAYLREDGTPYYIGKGKGQRINQPHGKPCSRPLLDRRIKLKTNLTEEDAFRHEEYMIAIFGRIDIGTGILYNKSDGGEGKSGLVHTQETRDKMSKAGKGKKKPPGHGEAVSRARKGKPSPLRGRVMPEEHRRKIGNSHAKTYQFLNPKGELVTIHNLGEFCKENGLSRSNFWCIMNGKREYYRGWRLPK